MKTKLKYKFSQFIWTLLAYFILIIWVLFASITLVSCEEQTEKNEEEVVYPVEVKSVGSTNEVIQLEYFGVISSDIINYSFVMPGKVESIYVLKNQLVKKGTKLMKLETSGLSLSVDAAGYQNLQAKQAYQEAKNYYLNLEKAFKSGGISKSDLEKAQLDMDVKNQEYKQTQVNLKARQQELNQATIVAKSNGIVSDIIPKEGELIQAGAETIVVQGTGFFAETSISQKDWDRIKMGAKCMVEYKGIKLKGIVSYISSLPDFQTFRHTVKIEFEAIESKPKAIVGSTVKIFIEAGKQSGMWIPIKYVFNDGDDYVNVVDDKRLRKKKVFLVDYSGDKALVEGLAEKELLITKGAANINEGYKVKITNHQSYE